MGEKPDISVVMNDDQPVGVDHARLAEIALKTAEQEGATGEISITLVGSERMAEMNASYMGVEGPTDVLSFPIDGLVSEPRAEPVLIGEIALCPEVAEKNVAQPGGNPAGLEAELELLIAHGVLHLLGYDHEDEEQAAAMRLKEQKVTGRPGGAQA